MSDKEAQQPSALCRLCGLRPPIKNSHVTSKLVFRAIKSDSPTGFFRNPNNPNQRLQDGDKFPLLCKDCEERFSGAENRFATHIFHPFHRTDQDAFSYGPWLHYFMTSHAWRTLILDLPGLEADETMPRSVTAELQKASRTMQRYLLGASGLGVLLNNHAVVFTAAHSASPDMAEIGPNVLLRRSVFGYTLADKSHGYASIVHNLGGFICVLHIKGKPSDNWQNTKINPDGGSIVQPQIVRSWVMGDVMELLIASAKNHGGMSPKQQAKVLDSVDSSAAALRFRRMDEELMIEE